MSKQIFRSFCTVGEAPEWIFYGGAPVPAKQREMTDERPPGREEEVENELKTQQEEKPSQVESAGGARGGEESAGGARGGEESAGGATGGEESAGGARGREESAGGA